MNETAVLEEMFRSRSTAGKEGIISFAGFLTTYPVSQDTAPLFLRLMHSGYSEVADALFNRRDPAGFFTTISAGHELIAQSLEILREQKIKSTDPRITTALFSLFQTNYTHPEAGMKIFPLTVHDIYQFGRFLLSSEDKQTELLLDLLGSIHALSPRNYREVPSVAGRIIDAYHDSKKKLEQIIPHNLLL